MDSSDRPDAAAMRAYADELREMFRQISDAGQELHEKARALRTTAKSRDGLVTVTVSARGELVGLDLDPRIYRHPDARRLAGTILDTVQRATDQARERVMEILEPVVPRDELLAHLDGDLDTAMARFAERMEGKR
ncbi:YbaB/EbfC family nucleoid-associated protein [Nonomuraea sp. LP-02]|uniref:YbaB/EbfC family nucleoid-associated protein n=1 Tax=Nonomuraea sp. LP-02 TaxID=3097960 RepID=UPI002E2EF242|nr:YbaB/EbfC family nucleoid-associated protein [Nonomuraea sp. LP-02]MED7930220.1 YbaB/EbfC family nucleoid-associated protein [Nonomuraea sp. LP-02]